MFFVSGIIVYILFQATKKILKKTMILHSLPLYIALILLSIEGFKISELQID